MLRTKWAAKGNGTEEWTLGRPLWNYGNGNDLVFTQLRTLEAFPGLATGIHGLGRRGHRSVVINCF